MLPDFVYIRPTVLEKKIFEGFLKDFFPYMCVAAILVMSLKLQCLFPRRLHI